jgi:hypothetical protein
LQGDIILFMIYTQVIQKIKEVADSVEEVAEVFMHPLGAEIVDFDTLKRTGSRITRYPALIFTPDNFDNSFSSVATNERTMQFKCWLVLQAENIENIEMYERVLPNAVDGVLDKFDKGWSFGTIDGHRIWSRMSTGIFGIVPDAKGREVFCEMTLLVRVETDVV